MGKIYTPTFRAEVKDNTSPVWISMVWNVKDHGRPSNNNAETFRVKLNSSFLPGGVNEHISKSAGFLVHVNSVRVIRQATGDVVAEAKAPMFEVV